MQFMGGYKFTITTKTEPMRIGGYRGKTHGECMPGVHTRHPGGVLQRGLVQFCPFSRDWILLKICKQDTIMSTVFAENGVCPAGKY